MKEQLAEIFAYVIVGGGILASAFVMANLPFVVYHALQAPDIQSVLAKQNLSFLPKVWLGLAILTPFIILIAKISTEEPE